jgi:hypothetical protein
MFKSYLCRVLLKMDANQSLVWGQQGPSRPGSHPCSLLVEITNKEEPRLYRGEIKRESVHVYICDIITGQNGKGANILTVTFQGLGRAYDVKASFFLTSRLGFFCVTEYWSVSDCSLRPLLARSRG